MGSRTFYVQTVFLICYFKISGFSLDFSVDCDKLLSPSGITGLSECLGMLSPETGMLVMSIICDGRAEKDSAGDS